METSPDIAELAAALSKAQSKITGALKDSSNPFFKSKYADLASCWDACRAPLTDCGLAVIQTTQDGESGTQVVTRLVHSSGQWVQGRLTLHPKDNGPQAVGSTLTYARRYALAAIVGLAQIDDDAEAATHRGDKLNGLPRIDPRGEAYKSQDMGKAGEYAERFRAALASEADTLLKELHAECNAVPDFYILVSTLLKPAECSKIKQRLGFGQSAGPRGIRQ